MPSESILRIQLPWPLGFQKKIFSFCATKFSQTVFNVALNYYPALNLNWKLTAPWTGFQVKVPVKFIVGKLDLVYTTPVIKEYVHNGGFKKDVPLLEEIVVIEDAAHVINREKPEEINIHIHDFIKKF